MTQYTVTFTSRVNSDLGPASAIAEARDKIVNWQSGVETKVEYFLPKQSTYRLDSVPDEAELEKRRNEVSKQP